MQNCNRNIGVFCRIMRDFFSFPAVALENQVKIEYNSINQTFAAACHGGVSGSIKTSEDTRCFL